MYNDTLQHYGVLGMKWGRRRASRLSNKQKRLSAKKDKYRKISDSELQNFNKRAHVSSDGTSVIMDNKARRSWNKSVKTAKKYAKLDRKEKKIAEKRNRVLAKLKKSEAKNKGKGKSALKEWVREAANTNQYSNLAAAKAHMDSRNEQFKKNWKKNKAKAVGTRLRRALVYTNTKELKDINRRLKGKRKSPVRSYIHNKLTKRKKISR